AHTLFLSHPPLIEIEAPVKICGDIHGQYSDLLRLFTKTGFPPVSNYLFLGDYVDRGPRGLETILLLLGCKECMRRYGSSEVHRHFQSVFNVMPVAALVSEKILCMHGGLSPFLNSLNDIR
ncbi:hypothetical protein PFISCL1PPCAC_1081, partial [Pristionchus fissidentatus]